MAKNGCTNMTPLIICKSKELDQQKECPELAAHPNWHYPCLDWSSLVSKRFFKGSVAPRSHN
jgi:hypothetical protein